MSEYFLVALGHSHHPHHRFVPHVVLAPLLAALLLLPLSAAATVLVVASCCVCCCVRCCCWFPHCCAIFSIALAMSSNHDSIRLSWVTTDDNIAWDLACLCSCLSTRTERASNALLAPLLSWLVYSTHLVFSR